MKVENKKYAYLGMTQRDLDFGDLLTGSGLFGTPMEMHLRNSCVVGKDLNVAHGRCGAFRLDTQGLEDRLLSSPSSGK
jgi:hypothetical protein